MAKDIREQGGEPPVYEPRLYLMNGVNEVFSLLSEDGKDKLHVLLEKCEVPLAVFFVMAETAAGVSSFSFRPWFKKQAVFNTAVWIGDRISDQFQFSKYGPAASFMRALGLSLVIWSRMADRL